MRDGGWIALDADPNYGGQGMPCDPEPRRRARCSFRQHGVPDVRGPDAWRDLGAPRARRRDEQKADLPAEDDRGPLDRHDEPDRAAMRHRPGPDPHQGRTAGGRHLPHHRPEDLDLGRRARHVRQHRPPRAGQDPGRARGREGHLPLHRAEVPRERGRQPRRSATRSPAAGSKRRWASTATPPA